MALAYEVKPEFSSHSLEQLLAAPVTCFEGVGETQRSLLVDYFGINTVGQLAEMPYFVWSLGLQRAALKYGSEKLVSEIDEADLPFEIEDNYKDLTLGNLLKSQLGALAGLSPGQNLAIYDAFRVSNIVQLAHNRIMLEARIIQFLHNNPDLLEKDQKEIRAQLSEMLGTEVSETIRIGSGELQRMAGEINVHLQDRVKELREKRRRAGLDADDEETIDNKRARLERIGDIRERTSKGREAGAEAANALRAQVLTRTSTSRKLDEARTVARERTTTQRPSIEASDGERMSRIEEIKQRAAESRSEVAETAFNRRTERSKKAEERVEDLRTRVSPMVATYRPGDENKIEAQTVAGVEAETLPVEETKIRRGLLLGLAAAAAAAVVAVFAFLGVWRNEPPPATEPAPVVEMVAPPVTTAPKVVETQPLPPPEPTLYTVRRGNSLWRISGNQYKDPRLWNTIYDANRDQIKDPNLIFPGQEFKIPPR